MHKLLLVLAHPPNLAPLPALLQEQQAFEDAFSDAAHTNLCQLRTMWLPQKTPADVLRWCHQHRADLRLFHFGGHADPAGLIFGDERVHGFHLAAFMQACPQVRLVVLNGCGTAAQAAAWLEAGVGTVITTSAPVVDGVAAAFAQHFYVAIASGAKIRAAFDHSVSMVKVLRDPEGTWPRCVVRDVGAIDESERHDPAWPFVLQQRGPDADAPLVSTSEATATGPEVDEIVARVTWIARVLPEGGYLRDLAKRIGTSNSEPDAALLLKIAEAELIMRSAPTPRVLARVHRELAEAIDRGDEAQGPSAVVIKQARRLQGHVNRSVQRRRRAIGALGLGALLVFAGAGAFAWWHSTRLPKVPSSPDARSSRNGIAATCTLRCCRKPSETCRPEDVIPCAERVAGAEGSMEDDAAPADGSCRKCPQAANRDHTYLSEFCDELDCDQPKDHREYADLVFWQCDRALEPGSYDIRLNGEVLFCGRDGYSVDGPYTCGCANEASAPPGQCNSVVERFSTGFSARLMGVIEGGVHVDLGAVELDRPNSALDAADRHVHFNLHEVEDKPYPPIEVTQTLDRIAMVTTCQVPRPPERRCIVALTGTSEPNLQLFWRPRGE